MKKIFTLLFIFVSGYTFAQIETPQASSAGSVSSRVGLTDITIDYFRPKMKGRKIFGEGDSFLQPNGKIWRTGANGGTKITFSTDVKVEGIAVPKGSYLIFTWPAVSDWTVALYKDLEIGGNTGAYDKSKEQANFKVKSEKLAETIQTLTIAIGDISDDNTSAKVQIAWENTSVKFGVAVDYDKTVMEAIAMSTKVNPDALITAARYYYDSKKDMKQALVWINEYFATPGHSDEFYNIYYKALIQKALGDKAGATVTAKQSLESSHTAKNDAYVKMNEELLKSLK